MLTNYHYFIALAEEENISRAAEKLFISHQCLSKYLKNLEAEYRIQFFERTPRLRLTSAGQVFLETLRQVQFLEHNLENQLDDIRISKRGRIRLGVTEGRYRLLIPDVLTEFKRMYPEVTLDVDYADTHALTEAVLKNELDLAIMNFSDLSHNQLKTELLLKEQLCLVISDRMLEEYFPDRYPECIEEFREGAELSEFLHVPFILNHRGFNSRDCLDDFARRKGLSLHCIMELQQMDLQFMMTARDYAACFTWSMYITLVQQMNRNGAHSRLHAFPLKDLEAENEVVLVTLKGKMLPSYGRDLVRLIKSDCQTYRNPDLQEL